MNDEEKHDDKSYRLIADIQNALGNDNRKYAQLFEVRHVWGFSSHWWTPMMWKLSLLCETDDCTEYRSRNRWRFEQDGDEVYEFLRLRTDHTGGEAKGFGLVGSYNGVLLWPDAFRYFLKQIPHLCR